MEEFLAGGIIASALFAALTGQKACHANLKKLKAPDENEITVATYNLLGQGLMEHSDCNRDATVRSWNYRKTLIEDFLGWCETVSADFICLQEADRYADVLKPKLDKLGYDSVAVQYGFPVEPTSYIVTAWKRSRWSVETIIQEDYANVQGLGDLARLYRATIAKLKNIQSGKCVTLANYHLVWQFRDCEKMIQLKKILSLVEQNSQNSLPILAGDTNAALHSPLHQYLKGQPLHIINDYTHTQESEDVIQEIFKTPINSQFQSCYEGQHAPFSNLNIEYGKYYMEHVDYIYIGKQGTVKELLVHDDLAKILQTGMWPNAEWPSDHLPMAARFCLDP